MALRDESAGRTMTMYRRLIAAGCGGIATKEGDAVVDVLGNLLDEGDSAGAARHLGLMHETKDTPGGQLLAPLPLAP